MRTIYFDCFSGISGDMALAALVDAGADRDYIANELKKIQIEPFQLEWKTVMKKGISALKANVIVPAEQQPHHHRHYSEIIELIKACGFHEEVTNMSLMMFEKIAIAEGKIHNLTLDKVHFHEVGAIDSIVDTVGVALAIHSLRIDHIWSSPVPLGSGTIHCDHGIYPVPAPATLEMMKGIPISPSPHTIELTTPTGAGIISGLVQHFSTTLPPMIVESIGYGAGTKDLPNHPNVLRCVIGNMEQATEWQATLPAEHNDHDHHHHHHHEHKHTDDHQEHHKHTHS